MTPRRPQVKSWLTFLAYDSTHFGRICAANLHDFLDKHFVCGEAALAFFEDCMGASDPAEALKLFNDACCPNGAVNPRHYGLNRVSIEGEDEDEMYAVVVRLPVITDYIDSGIDGQISRSAGIRRTTKP